MKNRGTELLMTGGLRDLSKIYNECPKPGQLNKRSGIRVATAYNGLEYAIRFLFAGRPVIGGIVMIRMLLRLPKVVEDVMDLMRCRVNDESEKKRREQKIAPATYRTDIFIALHRDSDNRASRRHTTNQDCS